MSRRIFWAVAALVALAACSKTQEEPVVSPLAPAVEGESAVLPNLFSLFQPATGGPATLGADFGGTRAHIEMNAEGTFADWVWKAGDSFLMFAVGPQRYYTALFTATEGGSTAEFTTRNTLTQDPPYQAVFPGSNKIYKPTSEEVQFGIHIPPAQVAVPGGIQDGNTVAVAVTQNLTDFIHFQSVVSLIRFRMSGAVASQVKTVTVKGSAPMAGDLVLAVYTDGSTQYFDNLSFDEDVKSQRVTLTGDFAAGQDYFLVLKPGTQPSFKMVFSDGAGHSTTKTASNITFPQSRISDFGTIDLGDAFEDEDLAYEPIAYMTATAGAPKPVTIAVIPDGFTKDELNSFTNLAKSGIDAMMSTEPYKSYAQYFNVWFLPAASKESGANVTDGKGNVVTPVNNRFGSGWGPGYGDMKANADDIFEFVTENCPDIVNGKHTIAEVPVLVIINDTRYGGICHNYANGQSYCMAPYSENGGGLSWGYPTWSAATDNPLPTPITDDILIQNAHKTPASERDPLGNSTGDWRNILVHEFGGHSVGRLGDEYWPDDELTYNLGAVIGHDWPVPLSLNVSADPYAVPWQNDVLDYPLASLVAKDPNYGRIGIFQGGDRYTFGRWRSEKISCMIDNRFYFSTWQRMLIVKRIMTLSGSTFDPASFWAKDVTIDPVRDIHSSPVAGSQPRTFREVPLLPPPVLHETF